MKDSATNYNILCNIIDGNDKKDTIFKISTKSSKNADSFSKSFIEFENLYERLKHRIPPTIDKPPKKKFLSAENKLNEKRRGWIEVFSNYLLNNEIENQHVQIFYAPIIQVETKKCENEIDLGPTQRKGLKASDFDILGTIGKGSYGEVYRVKQKATKKIYAMKVLGKENIKMRKEEKRVMAEKNVLKTNINHPFLVSLHFSFQSKTKLYFILDYINGGELFTHLQQEKNFSENRSRFYAAEIACALGYLHEKDIIYRDLKPENILLDRYGHVVLTDFGLCKEGIKQKDTTGTFAGTPEYLAPEVILKKKYDRTVDWWCLGTVLYEMLFGLPPFYSRNQKEMYDQILNQPLTISNMASPSSRDILQSLLEKDRHKRLGCKRDFEEIKSHEFFVSINWAKLLKREIKPTFIPKVKNEADDSLISDEFKRIKPPVNSLMNGTTYVEQDANFLGFTYIPSNLDSVNL
jgi:serine/threonine protein kinase